MSRIAIFVAYKEGMERFIRFALMSCLVIAVCMKGNTQTPVAEFLFDDCMITENQGNFINNSMVGTPICDCGPSGNALYFDGSSDYIILDEGIKDLLMSDFTLSFYFWPEFSTGNYNLFAIKKDDCIETDSTMHIQYDPLQQLVKFNLTNNLGDLINVDGLINQSFCWHHIVITKEASNYSFYIDEVFIQSIDLGKVYVMAPDTEVTIGNSECLIIGEELINGRIDDFVIYAEVLSQSEIEQLNIYTDQIITDNTTIFSGESVMVSSGATCTVNFSWSNSGDLDDDSILNPIITPTESTTYELIVDHDNCSVTDSIRINVIDSEFVDCEDLLLPRAFTPNGDGLNDTYGISNNFIVNELVYFEIFDRWGTLVFQTSNVFEKWDGNFKSSPLVPASYLYKIKYVCRSEEFIKTGNFSILR